MEENIEYNSHSIIIKEDRDVNGNKGYKTTLYDENGVGYTSFINSTKKEAINNAKYEIDNRVGDKTIVKSHTRTLKDGKKVQVKEYERVIPKNLNKQGIWEEKRIPAEKLSGNDKTTYFVKNYNGENHIFVKTRDSLLELNDTGNWARQGEKFKHFPNYEVVGEEDGNKYSYTIYAIKDDTIPLTKSSEKAYKDFKILQEAQDIVQSKKMNEKYWNISKERYAFEEALDTLESKGKKITPTLKEELLETMDNATNYGTNTQMYISKGTTRVGKDGQLIINNPFFER